MELRDIEIFLALAEELHFGRTGLGLSAYGMVWRTEGENDAIRALARIVKLTNPWAVGSSSTRRGWASDQLADLFGHLTSVNYLSFG